jgi:hypothetical protein
MKIVFHEIDHKRCLLENNNNTNIIKKTDKVDKRSANEEH